MKKRFLAIFMVVVMAFSIVACGKKDSQNASEKEVEQEVSKENDTNANAPAEESNEAAGNLIDGTFTATAQGFGGDVTVTLIVTDGKITNAEVTGDLETEGIGGDAVLKYPEMIVSAAGGELDSVTGATITSTAVKEAYAKALSAAKGEVAAETEIKDGTYTETAKGFYGDFNVTLTVADGKITAVEAGENMETPDLGGKAIDIINNEVVTYGTAGVDSVTGATLTSRAYLNAISSCLKQAEAPESFFAAAEYPAGNVEKSADVVVVGAGAAGFSSAINAAENGAKVILIEKQGIVGGSTLISAGIVYAAMDESDIPAMVDYYQTRAEGKADQAIVEFFCNNSLNTVKFLEDSGVQWFMTVPSGTAPEPRARFATNFTGASLIEPLEKRALAAGVEIITNCKATEILTDGNAVTGVKAEGKNIDYTFTSKAVILATGGFDASEELKAEWSPMAVGDFPLSNKGNIGEGIKMGMAVGADTDFKGGIIGFNVLDGSLNNSGQSGISMGAGVYVGEDGSYIIGNIDYPVTHTALHKSGFSKFYGIYDAAGEASGELAVSLGFGYKADSIEELAKAAGMDAAKLADAVAKNEALATAPFYAVNVKPATIGSMGGLKINTRAEVLNADGNPIGGLFAAGEVANGGLYYQEYPASGTSNSMSITFGLEAGKNAAEYVK